MMAAHFRSVWTDCTLEHVFTSHDTPRCISHDDFEDDDVTHYLHIVDNKTRTCIHAQHVGRGSASFCSARNLECCVCYFALPHASILAPFFIVCVWMFSYSLERTSVECRHTRVFVCILMTFVTFVCFFLFHIQCMPLERALHRNCCLYTEKSIC